MLYEFVVSPSTRATEPGELFCLGTLHNARQFLAQEEQTAASIFGLCEYLDLVDARTLPANPEVYRKAVTVVSEFMAAPQNKALMLRLVQKSWAAKALYELVARREPDMGTPLRKAA